MLEVGSWGVDRGRVGRDGRINSCTGQVRAPSTLVLKLPRR
jgi:hypothetical protein